MSQQDKKASLLYSFELKLRVVKRVQAGEAVSALAREFGIRRKNIYAWKDRHAKLGEAGLKQLRGRPREAYVEVEPPDPGSGELEAARARIAELERKVGQQELELDFFAEALRRIGKGAKRS